MAGRQGQAARGHGHLLGAGGQPNIIESKSFKLYLNSFNQTRLVNSAALRGRLEARPARPPARRWAWTSSCRSVSANCAWANWTASIDKLDIEIDTYEPAPELLRTRPGDAVEETLCSRLLKSNCPVTGQPDWASVQIRYRGAPIDREALLRYVISFRQHAEFHEHCVERIYTDIMAACRPELLTVYARYTRRGGLDINPWRSNFEAAPPPDVHTVRQ